MICLYDALVIPALIVGWHQILIAILKAKSLVQEQLHSSCSKAKSLSRNGRLKYPMKILVITRCMKCWLKSIQERCANICHRSLKAKHCLADLSEVRIHSSTRKQIAVITEALTRMHSRESLKNGQCFLKCFTL